MSRVVRERFERIARRYDFLNHFLSMGVDRRWRAEAAGAAMLGKKSFSVLDSATGTGDLALAVWETAKERGKSVRIVGTDFAVPMLNIARAKAEQMGCGNISFKTGDSLKIGYKSNSFDVITTSFSLRNFDDVNAFLRESYRVLKKDGKLVILEMALPDAPAQRRKFRMYSYFIRFMSYFTDEAYSWLVDSINRFDKHALVGKVRKAGFKRVAMRELRSGIAFLLTAEK